MSTSFRLSDTVEVHLTERGRGVVERYLRASGETSTAVDESGLWRGTMDKLIRIFGVDVTLGLPCFEDNTITVCTAE